jgi:hypothetical protein
MKKILLAIVVLAITVGCMGIGKQIYQGTVTDAKFIKGDPVTVEVTFEEGHKQIFHSSKEYTLGNIFEFGKLNKGEKVEFVVTDNKEVLEMNLL